MSDSVAPENPPVPDLQSGHLVVEDRDGARIVRLNRPERLNAVNPEMRADMHRLRTALTNTEGIRAIVFTGTGRAFGVGEDVGGMAGLRERPSPEFRLGARRNNEFNEELESLEIPVIAAVNGVCAGGALELALSCDFRIAAESARFGLPEVKIGLIPGAGGISRLARTIGVPQARRLVLLGEIIDAREALRIGLVDAVHPDERLMDEVMEFVKRLSAGAPSAVGLAKLLVNRSLNMDLHTIRDLERMAQSTLRPTRDHAEGVAAFKEKRPPVWEGR